MFQWSMLELASHVAFAAVAVAAAVVVVAAAVAAAAVVVAATAVLADTKSMEKTVPAMICCLIKCSCLSSHFIVMSLNYWYRSLLQKEI